MTRQWANPMQILTIPFQSLPAFLATPREEMLQNNPQRMHSKHRETGRLPVTSISKRMRPAASESHQGRPHAHPRKHSIGATGAATGIPRSIRAPPRAPRALRRAPRVLPWAPWALPRTRARDIFCFAKLVIHQNPFQILPALASAKPRGPAARVNNKRKQNARTAD